MKNSKVLAVAAVLLATIAVSGCSGQPTSSGNGSNQNASNVSGAPARPIQQPHSTTITAACPLLSAADMQAAAGTDKLTPTEDSSNDPGDARKVYSCDYLNDGVMLASLEVTVDSSGTEHADGEIQQVRDMANVDHVQQVGGLAGPALQYQIGGIGSWFTMALDRANDTVEIEITGPDDMTTQGYVTLAGKVTAKIS